jgi:hypothetical protein
MAARGWFPNARTIRRAAILALIAGLCGMRAVRAEEPAAATLLARVAIDEAGPANWDGRTMDVLPLVAGTTNRPELILAQRSITRDLGKTTNDIGPEPEYKYVEVPGWKSPGKASMMSLALPGTGQLYAGSSRGYAFLGVEAVAVLAFVKYRNDSHEKRDQYFSYVGDPNQPASRFSFDRLAGNVPPEELARLQAIYLKDPREFYDLVSTNDDYAAGWADTGTSSGQRSTAQEYIDQVNSLGRKSSFGLFTAIANHLASTIDALHLARMNNFALRDNLSLKIKVRPGARQSYGFTLTQKF